MNRSPRILSSWKGVSSQRCSCRLKYFFVSSAERNTLCKHMRRCRLMYRYTWSRTSDAPTKSSLGPAGTPILIYLILFLFGWMLPMKKAWKGKSNSTASTRPHSQQRLCMSFFSSCAWEKDIARHTTPPKSNQHAKQRGSYQYQINTPHPLITMASANVLRRLALQAVSKPTHHHTTTRAASTASIGLRSIIAPLSSSSSLPNNGASTHVTSRRAMATISAGDALARLASDHPHQEIIRYEHKNVKWTLKHVNYYSDALACGLVDAGLQPGDVVLSWLPLHLAEQVSLSFIDWI